MLEVWPNWCGLVPSAGGGHTSAADVKAPGPDIIIRRCATSERTVILAKTSTSPNDLMPGQQTFARRTGAVPATLTSSDGASATVALSASLKGD
jgi:hypothetical protein